MNARTLAKLGVPRDCIPTFINTIRDAAMVRTMKKNVAKRDVPDVVKNPNNYIADPIWANCAHSIIKYRGLEQADADREPISYKQWGDDIDEGSKSQIATACHLPDAVAAALMPDAHLGYGLPIGGVLAMKNAVIPHGVGVDIACRMRLSIFDMPSDVMKDDVKFNKCCAALKKGTNFGVGGAFQNPKYHDVLDQDWKVTPVTKQLKDKAWSQLGTSGSGNHFCEFGSLTTDGKSLGIPEGKYLALLSHSGSRGAGANVCTHYTRIAQSQLPKRYQDKFKFLAWLSLDSEEGQEYWLAMNLMGDYAAANHEVIHRDVGKHFGGKPIAVIDHHHNFAWKEIHNGEELIVHRKGATPAGEGVLGVIPGSMASPCYVVRGKGNADSLMSASHGAGRRMSRKAAKKKFIWSVWKKELIKRGVHLISAGLDEVPGAYKDIDEVMAAQSDLVETIGRFDPKIVKMCDDGSKPED